MELFPQKALQHMQDLACFHKGGWMGPEIFPYSFCNPYNALLS